MSFFATIMAGGAGTRFWPESRTGRPKQLLAFGASESLLQATVGRLRGLVEDRNLLILTNAALAPRVAEQLPFLPAENVIGEPCKRDTAPCIGLAAAMLAVRDANAIMAVMPSDHVISPVSTFQQALRQAVQMVEDDPARLVTFGIRPTFPAETFGYIERGAPLAPRKSPDGALGPAFQVARFREKPRQPQAAEFLASGNFYWNAGIFVWRAQTILDALAQYQPEMHAHLMTIAQAIGTPAFASTLESEFAAIRGLSIDYAVLEHSPHVAVLEAPFQWDDVGSWQAMARLRGVDGQGNLVTCRHVGVETVGTLVHALDPRHLIATIGVKDLLIVHTPDATLIADRNQEESVRKLVDMIREKGWQEHL